MSTVCPTIAEYLCHGRICAAVLLMQLREDELLRLQRATQTSVDITRLTCKILKAMLV